MEIQCPQCETLYEVDETRLQSGTTTLQCHACQHLFQFGSGSRAVREDQKRWMVRDPKTGDIRYLDRFDTLHEWIVERELDRSWQISRTGDKWKTLGDIGEFRPIFQAAENVSSLEADRAVEETPRSEQSLDSDVRARLKTLDQFDGSSTSQQSTSQPNPSQQSTSQPNPSQRGRARQEGSDSPSPSADGREARTASPGGAQSPSASRDESSAAYTYSPQSSESVEDHASDTPGELPPSPTAPGDDASGAQPEAGAGDATDDSSVRLDSDMFGSGAAASGGTATESERAPEASEPERSFDEPFDDELDYASEVRDGRSRWAIAAVVLLAVVGGGLAYLYVMERPTWNAWLGALTGEEAPAEIAKTSKESEGPSPLAASTTALSKATKTARRRAEAKVVSSARRKASGALADAVESGNERASKAADDDGGETATTSGGGGGAASAGNILSRADRAQSSGRSQQAKKLYKQYLEGHPRSAKALTGLGWSLIDLGRPQAATMKFQSALERDANQSDAYIGLGLAYRKLGKTKRALEAYDTYLSKFPSGSSASIARYQRKKLRKTLGIN